MKHNNRKDLATRLRKKGLSYREIEAQMDIARSTLSGWFKDVQLTKNQKEVLHQRWIEGAKKGRILGSEVNKKKRLLRLKKVDDLVSVYVKKMLLDKNMLETMFVGLYLGDGFKSGGRVGLGNANPDIVLLFVTLLRRLYVIDDNKLRAQIFARSDQNEEQLIDYWSTLLQIEKSKFYKTQFDSRTVSKRTWDTYHGVCAVVYADTLLQRRILAMGQEMVKYVSTLNCKGS